jgi:hypothetical protein
MGRKGGSRAQGAEERGAERSGMTLYDDASALLEENMIGEEWELPQDRG